MTAEGAFADFVEDSLQSLGPVGARRMFGGHGIFLDGLMFALIADDTLYLKVDDGNRPAFETRGLGPFVYEGKGRAVRMSYFEAPPDALDEPEVLRAWAGDALAAARRAQTGKRRPAKAGKRRPAKEGAGH